MNRDRLLKSLIRFPSSTPYDADCLTFLGQYLKGLGFHVTHLPFGPRGYQTHNIFATYGDGSPHFCFAGHTDVVPPGDVSSWSFPPFEAVETQGLIYGRGAVDMKGGIACFLSSVEDLIQSSFKGTLSLMITGDEEGHGCDGTPKVLEWLETQSKIPDFCLVGEPTSDKSIGDTLKIGRRGSLNCDLKVVGKQGHVAYPQEARNPLPELVAFLNRLRTYHWDNGYEHFPKSHLELTSVDTENPTPNVIPETTRVKFNIRFNPSYSQSSLRDTIETLARQVFTLPYTLSFSGTAEAFLSSPHPLFNDILYRMRDETKIKTGFSTSGGTSDARHIQAYCPVMELGLKHKTAHQTDECVSIEDLDMLERLYRCILKRFYLLT